MKRTAYIILFIASMVYGIKPLGAKTADSYAGSNVCRVRCRADEGVICLKRGPCEPENDALLKASEECRKDPTARYKPITKLLFVDILSQIIRLDREFPGTIDNLGDEERYIIETRLLSDKGINMFVDTEPSSPLTREELARVLKGISVEKELGFSSGLANQIFDLKNEEFIIYDLELYVDEGDGFLPWEMKKTLTESLSDDRHYAAKLDSCDDARIVFGDNVNGKIPAVGSRIKPVYKFYGREDEIVTKCEIAMLLSNPDVARSISNSHNPSRPLTKENFADLLIKVRHLEGQMPEGFQLLDEKEIYALQAEALAKHGINIFIGSDPSDFLTREELAKILYDCPVEEIIGISNGSENQNFELSNAGFIIYDLHTYADEGVGYEEWSKRDAFFESSSNSKDYVVKLDAGNYATVYFGDDRKGRIPAASSPIKVRYRLYAPVSMLTEDDIICALGRCVPVAEAYEPPPSPFEFPDPEDGYDDPGTHI